MISYVKGELAAIEEQKAIIDVGGIGYGVFMPHQALAMLPSVGNEVKLYTYLNVREDAMQLFGFLTKDDLEIFRLVIGVSGIGPKGGLNILSCMSPDELRIRKKQYRQIWRKHRQMKCNRRRYRLLLRLVTGVRKAFAR